MPGSISNGTDHVAHVDAPTVHKMGEETLFSCVVFALFLTPLFWLAVLNQKLERFPNRLFVSAGCEESANLHSVSKFIEWVRAMDLGMDVYFLGAIRVRVQPSLIVISLLMYPAQSVINRLIV